MALPVVDPFALSATQLQALLATDYPLYPELEAVRGNPAALLDRPATRTVLAQTEHLMPDIASIPHTPYTAYRLFIGTGDRQEYERPYFLKREKLGAAALRLFLGQTDLKNLVQDTIWNICEETNWVLPAHEDRAIDLFSAETAFLLAETLHLLGHTLDGEVRARVRSEVDRRVFDPYLKLHRSFFWYMGGNNWNGVCNGSIGATFLLLEPEPGRVARALELAFASLRHFLKTAFETDGSSTEGVAYWHYGLINLVALSEMLRARSGGAIDLLASEHMRRVAAYPPKMHLSGAWFASFSDCDETVEFNPGILARLAERTGEPSLLNLLAPPAEIGGDWRLQMMTRNMLWWNGERPARAEVTDAYLPVGGVARLVGATAEGETVVVAAKAGHNAENHNQNDIGSFLIHVAGENLLTDPGRGLYSRFYFGPQRYDNLFANSYGHSVPRIGGQLQAPGREYEGQMTEVQTEGAVKAATVEFAHAYAVDGLTQLTRCLRLAGNTVWVEDGVGFDGAGQEVEEAFLTWHAVEADGATATVRGERHTARLTIEAPTGATWAVERLEEACRANAKAGVLTRLTFTLPAAPATTARLRVEVVKA